jgi:signal transduction histidine kinase
MQLHGGDLQLESRPGQGTVARMQFPEARLIDVATGHSTAAHI